MEVLEHTADVGLRAVADTVEEAFAAVGEGLAEVVGAWRDGEGEPRPVEVSASDIEALLVAWVDELLFLHEAQDAVFGGFEVEEVREDGLRASVRMAPRAGRDLKGEGVKAGTYHRLRVARGPDGTWTAEVYLDV
ncbi:MAG: archease [Actinomycetota bacterium]|nr:archease [Actinomycetota bacterium]